MHGGAVTGEDDDRCLAGRRGLLQVFQEGVAVLSWQAEIKQDDVGSVTLQNFSRGRNIASLSCPETFTHEPHAEQPSQIKVVLYHQDGSLPDHGTTVGSEAASGK